MQYRPRSDTINTLLHEAIHAYFFITTSWRHSRGDDGTGHGTGFQLLADAVNNHGNYEVTIYHTFHDEVESYRTHVWQCDGPCKTQPPYFGLVKRSMNRAPGKGDTWWTRHQAECGGTYIKTQEPAPTKKQLDAMSTKDRAGRQKNKLDSWVIATSKTGLKVEDETSDRPIELGDEDDTSVKAANGKRKASALDVDVINKSSNNNITDQKRSRTDFDNGSTTSVGAAMVECPICDLQVAESSINDHLDMAHP